MNDKNNLEERLNAHPELKAQILNLLDLSEGDIQNANEIEEHTIANVQQLGHQVIQDWAHQREAQETKRTQASDIDYEMKGKKKLYWQTTYGEITIEEQIFIIEGETFRPFCEVAGVHCRGYSLVLQRAITDFGSEKSFDRASQQLLEHYHLDISASTVRRVTEGHGHQIQNNPVLIQGKAPENRTAQQLIVETDGTMIPIVKTDEDESSDNRKSRQVCWKEARLGLVYEQGSTTPIFGASTEGVEQMGDQLKCCAITLGLDEQTQIHGVGDGATWIADQINQVFGEQSNYLIDFFHLSDYLAAASKSCAEDHVTWLKEQQERLKKGDLDVVVNAMTLHNEPESVQDKNAPVRACLRYIQNRPGQFEYLKALQAELPIGSGQIESAHRYVIKERMNLTGAWWKIENARDMIGLRILRANGQWDNYWNACHAH